MISSKTGVRWFIEESTISCIHLKRIIMTATLDKINWKHQNQNVVKGHTISHPFGWVTGCLLWFLAATKQLYEWYFLSVCPSVRPSVRLSVCHTFLTMFPPSYHHEIFRSFRCSIEEVPFCFPRLSIKFQGHTGQKIADFDPNWVFPDCNFSFNPPMDLKWCTKLGVV